MAAGLGFKTFTTGEVLTAADTNGYLMQGVLVFASAAARDAAITSPQEGQCCYLKDTDAVLTYSGSAWVGFDDSNAIQNSIVDAKGDIVAASAADTPARLAVGSNGETLVADSSTSTGLRYQAPVAVNPVINGALDIWQRGTSFTSFPNTSTYTADRFYAYRNDLGSGATISRQASGLTSIQYAMRIARDSGNTSTSNISVLQDIESANSYPYAGKTITFSFYARAGANYSPTSSLLGFAVVTGTGTDQSLRSGYTGATSIINTTATLTTSWQRFTTTAAVGSSATQLGFYFYTSPTGTAGANDYAEFTGVQIEVASVATPFRRAGGTIQGELAACQRYYFRNANGPAYGSNGTSLAYSTTKAISKLQPPVTMRVSPTVLDFSALAINEPGVGNYAVTALTLVSSETGPNYISLETTVASGLINTRFYYLVNNNNSAGYVGVSAEL